MKGREDSPSALFPRDLSGPKPRTIGPQSCDWLGLWALRSGEIARGYKTYERKGRPQTYYFINLIWGPSLFSLCWTPNNKFIKYGLSQGVSLFLTSY